MPKYKVVLTAKNVDCCPLYRPGDKLVINFPEVDMEESNKVCAFLLAELLQKKIRNGKNILCEINENMPGKAEYLKEFGITEGTLRCPRVATGVSFEVKAVEELDELMLMEHEEFRGREDKRELIAKLRKLPALSAVSANDLFDILPEMKLKKYEPGAMIIEKGQPGRNFCVIYNGEVEVIQVAKDGLESVIGQIKAGHCFGEMSLLTNEPTSASIRAATQCSILTVNLQGFKKLMENSANMRLTITKLLAERIKTTNQRMGVVVASGMVGQLKTVAFPELVQTLSSTDSNGVLHIKGKTTHGLVYFEQGQIMDVEVPGIERADEGFYEMLMWTEGNFRFEHKENLGRERRIFCDTMGLLLEGMRRIDEQTKKWHATDFPV